ncbi:penicillin-binding protein 1C [Sinimarinibacterium sp. CAU 1509]|uniref:transglycosylase domain-containing protein n=1 Tax=Sinimarinibacterium sp. CAU 1509 TaxID=2562283 RepID=UPI0010ACE8F4|nr:transglycosylase domain-containing protein [Sinimarinibacterium sp. CAU 1509]TJY60955.1 penicillin-binding protein 1C [Sinimarinibacterium sp. CAU 1509]
MHRRLSLRRAMAACAAAGVLLLVATVAAQRALPAQLAVPQAASSQQPVRDRDGRLLAVQYDGDWNRSAVVSLEQMPPLLRSAFVSAEDRQFWQHAGVDWSARFAALWQNLRAGRAVRGASTISEQVVRLLHPRPRTVWSRWVEGFEAMRLEARFSKSAILEFYLNQVPYGANRRGVVQAARYYFGRSLETLDARETLALAVMVRAPSRLRRQPEALDAAITRLAGAMRAAGALDSARAMQLETSSLVWQRPYAEPQAAQFVAEVQRRAAALGGASPDRVVFSSLDADLQARVERLLADRLHDLRGDNARQAAALVVDLERNQIRAWAVVDVEAPDVVGIDAVRVPRQPGSTLKPFVYALAFEQGWSPQTLIEDAQLTERVNAGLHEYRNYSRNHYGRISVREALGNSLNVPAVKALQFVGAERLLSRLHALGVGSLERHPAFYGDGLALGNGEVSLYELVQAYSALARDGRLLPLTVFADAREARQERAVFSTEAARAINGVLSDPSARLLEFGDGAALRFAQRTAVKTGTSSDYRDAWTVAYTGNTLVGVWVGNLDARATDGVTGARGPALIARGVLAMTSTTDGRVLPADTADARDVPADAAVVALEPLPATPQLRQPYPGLQLALDPRIPDALEAFTFELAWAQTPIAVQWWVDGEIAGHSDGERWDWPLQRGAHTVTALATAADGRRMHSVPVTFAVR